jgi:heptosyltransferase III
MLKKLDKIAISRTDNIGDVVLALPVAGRIKKYYPDTEVAFIGRDYTRSIIESSVFVDQFIDRMDLMNGILDFRALNIDAIVFIFPDKELGFLAKKAGIPLRIGSLRKLHHLLNCTNWVNFTRRNSSLHESQLNFKLLKPLGIPTEVSKAEIPSLYGMKKIAPLPDRLSFLLNKEKFNLIIHPKSHGHGKEWPAPKYYELCQKLPSDKFNIIFTGTENEKPFIEESFNDLIQSSSNIYNGAGLMNLNEFISFIFTADGLLASGTGPLHVAAALGKLSVGFFPPMPPVYSQRWENLGEHAFHFEKEFCPQNYSCRKIKGCQCVEDIEVDHVVELLIRESY